VGVFGIVHCCGDGVVDTFYGEQCDFGRLNGVCLDSQMKPLDAGSLTQADGGLSARRVLLQLSGRDRHRMHDDVPESPFFAIDEAQFAVWKVWSVHTRPAPSAFRAPHTNSLTLSHTLAATRNPACSEAPNLSTGGSHRPPAAGGWACSRRQEATASTRLRL